MSIVLVDVPLGASYHFVHSNRVWLDWWSVTWRFGLKKNDFACHFWWPQLETWHLDFWRDCCVLSLHWPYIVWLEWERRVWSSSTSWGWHRQINMLQGHFKSQRNQLHRNVLSTSWLTCRSAVSVRLVSWENHNRIIRRNFAWSNLCPGAIIQLLHWSESWGTTFAMRCPDLHLPVLSRTKDVLCMLKVNFVVSYLRLVEFFGVLQADPEASLVALAETVTSELVVDWHIAKVWLNWNKHRELLTTASNFSTHRRERFDRILLIGTAHLFRSIPLYSLGLWSTRNSCWTTLQFDPMAWLRLKVVGASAALRHCASLVKLCCV